MRRTQRLEGLVLLLPAYLYVGAVLGYPIVYGLLLSFSRVTRFDQPMTWVGLQNYAELLDNPFFFPVLRQSLIWAVGSVVPQLAVGLGAALLLGRSRVGKGLALSALLAPWVASFTVTAIVWRWMFDSQLGIINDLIVRAGFAGQPVNWLASPGLAMFAVIVANVWKYFPFMMLMLMAGLQAISPSLYEAAEIDGAGGLQRFAKITLPLLRPVLFIAALLGLVHALNAFTIVYVMTGGGPLRSTEILPVFIHRLAFVSLSFEQAAAASTVLFLTVAVVVGVYVRAFRRQAGL